MAQFLLKIWRNNEQTKPQSRQTRNSLRQNVTSASTPTL